MPNRRELANAIRALSMDAVQRANSGHPGMPMGMADIAEVLWNSFLSHNPNNPHWPNRDRFVLSNGHGSMLLYSLLHLSGYGLKIEDLQQFRQLHSRTPGHPELHETPGVETTTGPLGQGFANAVGMALGEQLLANQFNKQDIKLIDHYTYCFVGDGCLMEGISHEAASLAGTLGLGKLIVIWDDNRISIDGSVDGWFNENTVARFASYNWHTIAEVDGHDSEAITKAISEAKQTDKPTFIQCKTTIGFGAPNLAGTAKTHGSPLGEEEIKLARKELSWEHAPFEIPQDYYQAWDAKQKGSELEAAWQKLWQQYQSQHPQAADELQRRWQGELHQDLSAQFDSLISEFAKGKDLASRKASHQVLENINKHCPELLGGSADLSCSNLTNHKNSQTIEPHELSGNYLFYGVREFGMAAIMNGLSLYGGFIPYGGTFLVFADYARNAMRLSALMKQKVIYVLTHDSIGLGEDGPTHQPIEHLNMLRMTPNMSVWRPCDAVETVVAWQQALTSQSGPSCLALSRQTLTNQSRQPEQIAAIQRGGYILHEPKQPEVVIIATGSEVQLAVTAAQRLEKQGTAVRVVSMPNPGIFLSQDKKYQTSVLPKTLPRVAIEAGSGVYWRQFVDSAQAIISLDHYGASAPAADLFKEFGFTVENVITTVQSLLEHEPVV